MNNLIAHTIIGTFLSCLLLLGGCKDQSALTSREFVNYVDEERNGLIKTKKIGALTYQVKHLPQDYLVLNDLKRGGSQEAIKNTRNKYENLIYFQLTVKSESIRNLLEYNLNTPGEYQDRISYLSFVMQNDIRLSIDGKNTFPCILYHFERNYNLRPYINILFAFKRSVPIKNYIRLIINDNAFNSGILKFKFHGEDINSIPNLMLNSNE